MAKELTDVLRDWEAVIGLEIHTEITAARTKMFCGCAVAFGGEPNTRVCPVCLGMPGALPVPNEAAVQWTVLAGLATGCAIAPWSQFHRKNYFYPDMPKDYQISQYDKPFCESGSVLIEVDEDGVAERVDRAQPDVADAGLQLAADGKTYATTIGITRIHLEEDTGKMVHLGGSEGRIAGAVNSLVDFNRAGTPLMELVSEPDLRTPEEARRFVQKLRLIWQAIGISDGNMEEGSMRVDANVSVRRRGEVEFGTKAELKNMNSFKALHDGLVYEIVRQAALLESGGRVVQETRHWDATKKVTSALRSKEEAHDYRYFPEPDMVPFEFSSEYVQRIRERLPELPDARRARYVRDWGLPTFDAAVLTADLELAAYFEEALELAGSRASELAAEVAKLLVNDLRAYLNAAGVGPVDSVVRPAGVVELVALVDGGTISGKQAKEVFAAMCGEAGASPAEIVEKRGMRQLSDTSQLATVIDGIVAAHPDKVEAYRGGKAGLIGFFVGQVMRETGGQANPQVVNELLQERLTP
ncbi:MAG: Asp-tRNA(Asn)/Glu-tRNA(Gln) amidotransferase subunit GatB [Actinomycetes bacterium]|jgi:aspartyl-tRNA(Asn)/glutamyl-tRNA(Gln) amidotransferase subunit B|nr:Asp-tRNA(Asn)/Glu-tRNA(Gln) amidotransferase subunit GatB [Actinomycetes bacterium]